MINPIDRTTKRISNYQQNDFFNDIPEMSLHRFYSSSYNKQTISANSKQLEERIHQHTINEHSIVLVP